MYRQGLLIFFLAIAHPLLCYGKVEMADDPIIEYLNLNPKSVFEHELIDIDLPKNVHKRSTYNKFNGVQMRIRVFGQEINKWLYPRDSLFASNETTVYFANPNRWIVGGVSYDVQAGVMARVGQLFEDPEHYSSVVIGTDTQTGEPAISGQIPLRGDNAAIMIRPLPGHIVEEHLRKRRSIGEDVSSSLNLKRHVAVKINDYFPDYFLGKRSEKVNVRGDSIGNIVDLSDDDYYRNPSTIDYSNSIYPKLFLHYDDTFFKSSFGAPQSEELLRFVEYVLAFWNGVDLAYRQLENPSIRFHISGIAVATNIAATPYIHRNLQERRFFGSDESQDFIYSGPAIDGARAFFYDVKEQLTMEKHDVAVTMTRYPMDGGYTLGIAGFRGACQVDPYERKFYGVSLLTDNGVFGGIDTAVHEIGHTLGLDHDNGTVDQNCDKEYGFIMAPYAGATENKGTFSRCSLRDFNIALNKSRLRCMYEPPKIKLNLPKLMPGKMKTLDQQCQAYFKPGACFNPTKDVCVALTCRNSWYETDSINYGNECFKLDHGAAPGTPCGNGPDGKPRFCLQKQCVSLD